LARYFCPLCKQPVPSSLYNRITGIWKERQRQLRKIREERERLADEIRRDRKKLRREKARFQQQKTQLIKRAVDRRTRSLESRIEILKNREEKIEKGAQEKIQKATALAHAQAEKQLTTRLNLYQRRLRISSEATLRREKEVVADKERARYKKLEMTLRSTLTQMKTQNAQLRTRALTQAEQIRELQQQLAKQTTPQIEGLLHEDVLLKELRRRFPEDRFQHPGKRGDIIHTVMRKGIQVGVIVYECKRVKHYSGKHVKQALEAKEKRKADFAILVTNAMKKGTHGFFTERGVMIVHATGVLSLAHVLRDQIVQIARMKLGQLQRNRAIRLTLDYLEGPEFSNSMDAVIRESLSIFNEMMDEMKKHRDAWKKRYDSCKKIVEEASIVKSTSKAVLSGEPQYKRLIRRDTLPALPQLPM